MPSFASVGAAALLVAAVATTQLEPAHGWWCTGHMLTAMVAAKTMSNQTMAQVEPLIKYLAQEYPESPDYTTSACWADDLKSEDVMFNEDQHFINLPYVRDPMYSPLSQVNNVSSVGNAINMAVNTMMSDKASQEDKARMLRFIIHFIGDSHQPCHAATMYKQDQFNPPEGDRGCNLYKVHGTPSQTNTSNLHFFLDGGAGQWEQMLNRPLLPNGTAYLESWTQTVMTNYPMSGFKPNLAKTDVYAWLAETYYHATTFAYTTPEDGPLSADFVAQARKLVQSQVALGGYRLAQTLENIFNASATKR